MFQRLYDFLVNSNRSIKIEYTRFKVQHNRLHNKIRIISWLFLIYLILKYRVFNHPELKFEDLFFPESNFLKPQISEEAKKKIQKADMVFFDINKVLLLSYIPEKQDLFSLIGIKTKLISFSNARINAEKTITLEETGTLDYIGVNEIYEQIKYLSRPEIEYLKNLEFILEKELSYSNDYIRNIYLFAKKEGKIVIGIDTSFCDKNQVKEILCKCGYDGIDSTVKYRNGKLISEGFLHENQLDKTTNILYIGAELFQEKNNILGDYQKNDYLFYPDIYSEWSQYRINKSNSLSTKIYNAIVNANLHNGETEVDEYYEYGLVYGGCLVYGYCQWLERLAKEKSIEMFLFTARDTEIFYKVYKNYFNSIPAKYIFCSREALLKAAFPHNSEIFFDIMFGAKAFLDKKTTIFEALNYAGLSDIGDNLEEMGLTGEMELTQNNLCTFEKFFYKQVDDIKHIFSETRKACLLYLKKAIESKRKICIVDLGWRGTIYSLLRHLMSSISMDNETFGAVIGTINCSISNELIESQLLNAYCFSHKENIDLQIGPHQLMLVETLFSSASPSTIGYEFKSSKSGRPIFEKVEKDTRNMTIHNSIKNGMLKYCYEQNKVEKITGVQFFITGREACFPLFYILKNYDYNIKLFGKIMTSDLSAYKAEPLEKILKRLGYKKN